MNHPGSSHQFQFQKQQARRYFNRQRSLDHDQPKINGLTRESAITQFLRHKKMSSNRQNPVHSGDDDSNGSHQQNGLQIKQIGADDSLEGKLLKPEAGSNEMAAIDQHDTEGNTRGTIQNENDFNLLNAANSYSLNEGEPAPISTINDNTATFRGKENSHYNAYDLADADLNSVNFRHPSKESLQKPQYVQSIESFSNQNNNMVIQKQNVVVGNAAAASTAQSMPRPSHLNAKQKQISLQNLFDQSNNRSELAEEQNHSPGDQASVRAEGTQREAGQKNCATFSIQNLQNREHHERQTDHHTSVFTEQADIIGPEEFDEFAPLQKESVDGQIQQSTPALENFSSDTPADKIVNLPEPSDRCAGESGHGAQQANHQQNDVSQNANIITENEEEHQQKQMIQGPITENKIGAEGPGTAALENRRRFNSHLSAFCKIQLSTREKQQAWQNLQIEGMAFSQPDDDVGHSQFRRQSEGELEQNRRVSRLLYQQDRENILINHILGDDDSKPLMGGQGANLALDRPSHMSRPSYTQFDAMTPISMSGAEALNINSQRPQSTTKTTQIQMEEEKDKLINLRQLQPGLLEGDEQYGEKNLYSAELSASAPMDQFHELQASPHKIQARETERHTARLSSGQQLQGMGRSAGAQTQQHTIDTQLATTETATRPTHDPDQSPHALNQQNILKNIFFSKDSLQNPQIIKQNENIQIAHNTIKFKSILSSFVDERQDQAPSLKKDLKDINLNLVQVTDHHLQKSKYLMQLMISDPGQQEQAATQHAEAFEQQTGQVDPQDAKVESSCCHESKLVCQAELLQEQLLKLDYENNFDQAYNQVNELMINNLIDDQQAAMQKGSADSKEHHHYLLLGGGECFTRSAVGSHEISQEQPMDTEEIGRRDLQEQHTQELRERLGKAASRTRANKVPSALISVDALGHKPEEMTVFDRLNRPKSTRSKDAKKSHPKQVSQQTCRKPVAKQNDGASSLGGAKPAHLVRPATQLIQDLYYDYFTRNKKKEKQQQDSQESRQKILIQKSQENLHKQNVVLAQRISGRVQKAFGKVCQSKRTDEDIIDYQSFLSILNELYYVDLEQKNEELFKLAQAMWRSISRIVNRHHQSRGSELSLISKVHSSIESSGEHVRRTALRDLETFIFAMENVHFLRLSKSEKAPFNLDKSCLEKYNIYDPSLVKKVSAKFKPMVAHRQRRLAQIVEEKELQHFKNINRFEPRINRKSEIMVNMKPELSQRGISARNTNSRANSKDKAQAGELAGLTVRSQRSLSAARPVLGHRSKAQSLSRSRSRLQRKAAKAGIKYDEFMMGRAQDQKDRPQHQLLNGTGSFTGDLPEQCTFSPKINSDQAYKSILSNRNGGTQIKHAKSSALKRARSFEANQRLSIHIPDGGKRPNQNVFFNLYKIARERQEKSADSYRMAKEQQAKREAEECTFKPDFSKTHSKTKKYLERRGVGPHLEQQHGKHPEQTKTERTHAKKSSNLHAAKGSQHGQAKNKQDPRSSANSKKESAITTQRSKSNIQGQSSQRLPKKKKSRQKNDKLRRFTTQLEKENAFKSHGQRNTGAENTNNHLRSFVTEQHDEPVDRSQLLGSRLMSKKLNLSDVNCINSPENQGKVVQSVQNCRAEKMHLLGHKHIDFQKIHAQLDQSFLGQNTNWAHLGSSHQKPSSMTQSIQFNNLDEIIATDGNDDTCDLAEETAPAQVEMTLQVSPDSTRRIGPQGSSNRTNLNGDSTTNSLEVVLDVQLNDLHQSRLRPQNS